MKEKDWQNVVPKTPASLEESLNKALESMKHPPLSGESVPQERRFR